MDHIFRVILLQLQASRIFRNESSNYLIEDDSSTMKCLFEYRSL